MPVAHIKSTIAVSFNSHGFWQRRKIPIRKTNSSEAENVQFATYNICLETDLDEIEITEWKDKVMTNTIISEADVIRYLGYSKFSVEFTDGFMKALLYWKVNEVEQFKYILLLMKDVETHPFTGGMGQTENLKNRGKEASKRITNRYPDGDRLSYIIENNVVKFIACKGHYKFH